MTEIIIVPIGKVKPNPKNPRTIKDDKFAKLVKSLLDFPEMLEKRPLVCFTDTDKKYVPLGGNMRRLAAIEAGIKEVPIMLADDWTQEQKNEFVIKDNVGYGEWDYDQLANEWDVVQLDTWGLDIPDFKVEDPDDEDLEDLSDNIKSQFKIEVVCKDETEQEKTYNRLIAEGFECRLLTL